MNRKFKPQSTSGTRGKVSQSNITEGLYFEACLDLPLKLVHFGYRRCKYPSFNMFTSSFDRQTEVDRGATVGRIGNPLNQRLVKASQLESSGGVR